MRMRNRGWLAASGVLIAGVIATACATLPTSGTVQLSTQQGSGGQAQHGVQIVPVPPGAGWPQTEIVKGFLAASASFDNKHGVARQYLTGKFKRIWRPGWAATIIDSPDVSLAKTPKGVAPQTRPSALVYVTGLHVAKLQTAGQDQAGSVVASPAPSQYQFSLAQVAGGWRIDSILRDNKPVSPSILLLSSTDFARDYQSRDLYFYSMRGARDALVPDPVYIPQTAPESEVRGLVNALIRPSLSWLWGAATSAFPSGTKLITPPQVIGGITAVVDVGGAASRASRAQQQRMAAQLYWSLTCAPYATQCASPIKSVVLHINHRSWPLSPSNVAPLVPRGTSGALYYQPTAAQELAVAKLPPGGTRPVAVPLPAGIGSAPFTSMAVSTGQQGPPTLAGCTGRELYLIKLTAAVEEAKKLSAALKPTAVRKRLPGGCSSLSWDNSGNLWITAKSKALVLPTAGAAPLAKVSLVSVQLPQLSSANPPPIAGLGVAPDGVRVAVILGAGRSKKIQVGAISKSNLFTYIGQTQQTLRVGSDIANPVGLTWLDPDHLLVLSRSSSGRTQLFEVPLNGGQSAGIPIPGEVMSVSASWPNGQAEPQVVIGLAPTVTSPGEIDMSKGAWPNPDWVPVAQGTLPVYPG